jgi:hypothetical protein
VIEGQSQEIWVKTNPAGATCTLNRQGQSIGTIWTTPAIVEIPKNKYDLTIVCQKPGYMQATLRDHSGAALATFGNIWIGGLVGWTIDSATGSDNKYDSPVTITLQPGPAAVPVPLAGAPQSRMS